jgi:hypothetical protein
MNIVIKIYYKALEVNSKSYRSGLFPLKGKSPEEVAFDFWKWIKNEEPLNLELLKVIVDGDQDITEKIKELERAPLE